MTFWCYFWLFVGIVNRWKCPEEKEDIHVCHSLQCLRVALYQTFWPKVGLVLCCIYVKKWHHSTSTPFSLWGYKWNDPSPTEIYMDYKVGTCAMTRYKALSSILFFSSFNLSILTFFPNHNFFTLTLLICLWESGCEIVPNTGANATKFFAVATKSWELASKLATRMLHHNHT